MRLEEFKLREELEQTVRELAALEQANKELYVVSLPEKHKQLKEACTMLKDENSHLREQLVAEMLTPRAVYESRTEELTRLRTNVEELNEQTTQLRATVAQQATELQAVKEYVENRKRSLFG
jgi:uncharacterized protein (DUF3084 family)